MSSPAPVDYCIDSWVVEAELRFHSPCSGLYLDGYALLDGRYILDGNAVVDPFFNTNTPVALTFTPS